MKKLLFFSFIFLAGHAFAVNTSILRPQKFTVTDYNGCIPNGVVDCSTAVRTAVAYATSTAGGIVQFPAGTYGFGTSVVVYSSTTLDGISLGAVTLKAIGTFNDRMIQNQARTGTGTDSNITIKNIIFDENGRDTAPTFARVDNLKFERCIFKNGSSGLFLLTGATYDDNHHCYFIDCVFDSHNLVSGGTDITDIGNGKDIQMIRCVFLGGFTNSGNPQVSAAGMDNFVMDGCYFDGQRNATLLSVFGVHGGGIYNSELLNSNGFGLKLTYFQEGTPKRSLTDFKVMNNHLSYPGDNNIWVRQEFSSTDVVKNITISGNTLDHAPKSQIAIEIGNGFTISNNVMYDGSTASSGTYAVINATGVAGATTIYNMNIFGNHYFDDSTTPSQTLLYKTNWVSTFTSRGNIAENITTRSSSLNTSNFLDFDSSGTDGLAPLKAMVTSSSGTFTTSVVTSNELAVLSGTRFKVGVITRDMTAANGSVAYTGVGFVPKSIIFIAGNGSAISIGFDTVTNHGVISTFGTTYTDTSGNSVYIVNGSDVGQKGVLSSLDSDGFTMAWTKSGSPGAGTADVYYMAFK